MNNVQTVEEIFAGRIMQVPDYQRGYAWDERNWDDFLDDLDLLEPGKQHYTGTLVLHSPNGGRQRQDEEGSNYEVFHIVDGQQRLTTIVLLLDALRREVARAGKLKLAEGIKKKYISVPDFDYGQPLFKLQLNQDTHDFFVNVLSDQPDPEDRLMRSQERLIKAKKHFSRYLAAKEQELGEGYQGWLLDLYNKITTQLKVSLYNVEQSSEVGVIFEVMNNRGKPLSELEKVKNYLLYLSSKLSTGEHDLAERINATWTNIFKRLMASGLVGTANEDQLLRVQWLIAYDYRRKNWDGSKSVKEKFSLKHYKGQHKELLNDLKEYTRSLNSASLAYCDVANPGRGDNAFSALRSEPVLRGQIIEASDKLKRVRAVATSMPLLVAARLRYPEDGGKYLEMVKTCEVFAFRVYRLRQLRSNTGDSTLLRMAYQLYSAQRSFEQVIDDLRGTLLYYCSDHRFEEAFRLEAERDWYRWGGLKYFLYEYEQHLAGNKKVQYPWNDEVEGWRLENTIEHILPQTPRDKYWTSRFDEESRRTLTHDLGNLCLTYDNSAYGNKPFPAKRGHSGQRKPPCYASSDLFQERELSVLDHWNVDELKKRRDKMVNWALSRWHVDQTEPAPPDPEEIEEQEVEEQELAPPSIRYDRA